MPVATAPAPVVTGTLTVALAGNPNSGKTTVFNGLTGLRQKVANYPGITVEKKTGRCPMPDGRLVDIVDLPGTYSLVPHSPDEEVAMQVLRGLRADTPLPDVIVAVVDASNLARNLYLVSQLAELDHPMVVALNMTDIAARRGVPVDAAALAARLGIAVVPLIGHRRRGFDALKTAILAATRPATPAWRLPEPLAGEVAALAGVIAGATPAPGAAATALRLLAGENGADLAAVRGRAGVAAALGAARARLAGRDVVQTDIEARYRWIDEVVAATVAATPEAGRRSLTERVDAVLVHRFVGLVVFTVIMASLFVTIFWAAKPIMDALQDGITRLGALLLGGLAEGPLRSLLAGRGGQGRRFRGGVRPADRAALPVPVRARGQRLPGARRLPHGPPAGEGRAARQELHPPAVVLRLRHPRHHGDAHHRQPARAPRHHPGRALHVVQRAPPGLRAGHRHLLRRAGRARPGRHPARLLRARHRRGSGHRLGRQALPRPRRGHAVHPRDAQLQGPPGQRGRAPGVDQHEQVPDQGRHHHLLPEHPAVGAGLLPAPAR